MNEQGDGTSNNQTRVVEDGIIDINLLYESISCAGNPLDFYASGIFFLQEQIVAVGHKPQWFKTFLEEVGYSYGHTRDEDVQDSIHKAFEALRQGGVSQLPGWSINWSEFLDILNGTKPKKSFPISHCLKVLSDNEDKIPFLNCPKLIFGMILGDIGAALCRAKSLGDDSGFICELNQALNEKAKVKDLLDLYYMFNEVGECLLAGYQVEILGTASTPTGGPDFSVSSRIGSSWKYFIEANRKEPIKDKPEAIAISEAIDEKAKKFRDSSGIATNSPGIIYVDITSTSRPSTKEILKTLFLINKPCRCRIYKAYLDKEFINRLKKIDDALAVASVKIAQLSDNGSGVVGVLLTRRQYLMIDTESVAQEEGSILIIHRKYESSLPLCIAKQTYLIDESCLLE